tara:strand:+ start:485 stop:871 length:387 start_codon:yes stop_codon:yes gene_type:complete
MKHLKKYELNYLRHLYRKDLSDNTHNTDTDLFNKLDAIMTDAKELSNDDEIMWTLRPKKHYSNKSKYQKTKRRFVVELTSAEISTICGSLNIQRDGIYDNDKTRWNELTKLWTKICHIRNQPMKEIKY